jgi:putative aldouronate transport system substrate-binding protein
MANDLAAEAGMSNIVWKVADTCQNYVTGEGVVYKVANPWGAEGLAFNANIDEATKIAAIKFLDYNFSDECALLYYYGIEGEDYNMENGVPVRTQSFSDSETTRKKAGWLYSMSAYAPIEMYSDLSQPAIAEHWENNAKDFVPMPIIAMVGDNVERLNGIMAELMPFTQTARDEFVTGNRSFDEWDAYVAECEALGSEEGNGYVQEWMDAYYAGLN